MSRPTGRPMPEPGGGCGSSVGGTSHTSRGRYESLPLAEARAASLPPEGNLCKYAQFQCHAHRLTQYDYCIRHILTDKSAPYKPCGFTSDPQSGLKCGRPAPAYARVDSFCVEHTASLTAARHNLSRKRKPPASILMDSLAQYKKLKVATEGGKVAPALDLFNLTEDSETEGLGFMALESEGLQVGGDDLYIGETYVGEGESDAESADSEPEDALQNAGVYTGEEVIRTMRDKLIKLQKFYIDQFQRLGHKMKESRRVYLSELRAEKEAGLVSIYDQPKDVQEYARMKAMLHYYNPVGREALLSSRNRERRMGVASSCRPAVNPPCQHMLTTTTKCNGHCVPLAKFCLKHILEEAGQVLYRPCGVVTPADGPCETPVAALFPNSTCLYHTKVTTSSLSPPRGPKGGEKKDGKGEEKRVHVKKEEGEEVAQVKEIKRRNLANEIEQEKKLTPEGALSPIKEESCHDDKPDKASEDIKKEESYSEVKTETSAFDKLLEKHNSTKVKDNSSLSKSEKEEKKNDNI